MAKEQVDPEVDSEFARGKALAKEKGTPEGIDPVTGERAAVTYRQCFNETGGDEAKAKEIFDGVARAGGFGNVAYDQALDVRSLSRSVEENKILADRSEDLYGKRQREQQAQHQDNLVNAVGEVLEKLREDKSMAGSALNFSTTQLTNQYGWFWVGLAIPGAAARITLHTDGTPESVANPTAKHLGHTTEGWEMSAAASTEDQTVDEQVVAVDTVITEVNLALAANLAQTQDISGVLQHLVSGFGTYGTAAGYEQIQLGITPLVYTACALIFPSKADATKFVVYNLYKSKNDSGLANQIRRRGLGNNPVSFRGYAISSRAATDTSGNYWKQI